MANPSTYPSDGRVTSLQNYSSAFTGGELFSVVAPGNATAGINYNVTAQFVANQLVSLSTTILQVPFGGTGTSILTANGVLLANGSAALSVEIATTAGYALISNGSASAPSFQAQSLTSTFVSGFLGVSNGGIGTTTLPLDGVVLGNATALSVAAATTAGYPLVSNGSTSAPTFQGVAAPGVSLVATSNALATVVAIATSTIFVVGPSVAQGTAGTWFASGTVSIQSNTTTVQTIEALLSDGSNNIDSTFTSVASNGLVSLTLSGVIASPLGNIAISVNASGATASIRANDTGHGHDSQVTAIRIG